MLVPADELMRTVVLPVTVVASAIDRVMLDVVTFTIPSVVVKDPEAATDRYPIDNDPTAKLSQIGRAHV